MTKTNGMALCLGLLLILLLVGAVWAGHSAAFTIDWRVMSGGGAPAASNSSTIAMNGSLGQTAVGDSISSGGSSIALGAGYWTGAAKNEWQLLLPAVMR